MNLAKRFFLYWPAMLALAPLGEEFFFRGFLFKGILHSRLGAVGAVLLTSLAWTSLHVQRVGRVSAA